MKNGGGPACLRLRVVLTGEEIQTINPKIFYSEELHSKLENIINRYYPEKLMMQDLLSQDSLDNLAKCYSAFEELI